MQLFRDLDVLSFVRTSRLNWIGHVNRMDGIRKVCQVFNSTPRGSRLRGRPKNGRWQCVLILINVKLLVGMRGQKKKDLTVRSPLRRQRTTLDYSTIGEEEEEESGKTFYMRNLCAGKFNTVLTAVLLGL